MDSLGVKRLVKLMAITAAVIWVAEKFPTIAYIDILTCVLTFVFEEDI